MTDRLVPPAAASLINPQGLPRPDGLSRRGAIIAAGAAAGSLALAGCAGASPAPPAPAARTRLGVDVLAERGFAALAGKRVGLVTNQTGVTGTGALDRVVLKEALGERLKVLFGPEHGLDTRARAGDHVDDGRDPVTGLPVYSLYGARRKPTRAMLEGLDALVFNIQDIGIRSYTYISTMALAMEACGEAGVQFIVLDRPNPMGGLKVQGPPLEPRWKSFVGQVPVPYLHGLTIGELARMIVAERWIDAVPRLDVVAMEGWSRSQNWGATGLDWVATSPNIPRWTSPYYCAATGILGELRGVELGINSAEPFEVAAAEGVEGAALAQDLSAAFGQGIRFEPYVSTRRQGYTGVRLVIDPDGTTDLMAVGIALIAEFHARARPGSQPLALTQPGGIDLFRKAYGSELLEQALRAGRPWQELVAGWQDSLAGFQRLRASHLLYS
jgi:uncharacterized protein YbbC (DUF1343 family)